MKKVPNARYFLILIIYFAAIYFRSSVIMAEEKVFDYVIKNALIFDGRSSRGFQGDVAIIDDTIAQVGSAVTGGAREVIDAEGLVLAPGFIDAHTHSDFNPLIYPELANKLMQGVTTEIAGNCGMSAAPVEGFHKEHIHDIWAREGVEIPDDLAWESFGEYQNALEQASLNTNIASLVGHGNLRAAVLGLEARPATADEIKAMKKLLAQAMKEGAYGISFGLVYWPGIFAQKEELIELCAEAAKYSGVCAFHMRSESSRLLEAVGEAIEIGEKSNARIQISHLKAAGKKNWSKIDEAFNLIEQARSRGVRIEADAYPYTAGFAELGVVLPDAIYERKDRLELLKDPLKRDEILQTLKSHYREKNTNWDNIVIATTPVAAYQSYQGKSLASLGKEKGKAPEEVLIELLTGTSFEISAFSFSQSQDVVDRVLSKPYVTVGSDSIADGSLGTHPRSFGAFPKVIKEYVQGKKILELGDAIRKMTSEPAAHFGVKNRGVLESGKAADLVIFDPKSLRDQATYQTPNALSQGVAWVFVNGKPVVRKGNFTGKKNGRFLLRNG